MLTKLVVIGSFAGALVLGALGLQHTDNAAPGTVRAGVVAVNAATATIASGRAESAIDCAADPHCVDPALLIGTK